MDGCDTAYSCDFLEYLTSCLQTAGAYEKMQTLLLSQSFCQIYKHVAKIWSSHPGFSAHYAYMPKKLTLH